MTITEQQGEDPLWGGPHMGLCSQPCAVLHRTLPDSSQARVYVLNKINTKIQVYTGFLLLPKHKQLSIKANSTDRHSAVTEFFLEPGKPQPA